MTNYINAEKLKVELNEAAEEYAALQFYEYARKTSIYFKLLEEFKVITAEI